VTWTRDYPFREPLLDVRKDSEQAGALAAELGRELAPGHVLHGKALRVIARALPNDDVVIECGEAVAVVHLTWTQKPDTPPWPLTTWIDSAGEFESYVESEYDWEP
jgi:hypothetical protein